MANDAFDNAHADKEALAAASRLYTHNRAGISLDDIEEGACATCGVFDGEHSDACPTRGAAASTPPAPDAVALGKGDIAVVVKGRKVPLNTVGRIFWEGTSKFGVRFGMKVVVPAQRTTQVPGDTVWVAAKNVRPITPELRARLNLPSPIQDEADSVTQWTERKLRELVAAGEVINAGRTAAWAEGKLEGLRQQGADIAALLDRVHAAGVA